MRLHNGTAPATMNQTLEHDAVDVRQRAKAHRAETDLMSSQRDDLTSWLNGSSSNKHTKQINKQTNQSSSLLFTFFNGAGLLGTKVSARGLVAALQSGALLCKLAAKLNELERRADPSRRMPAIKTALCDLDDSESTDTSFYCLFLILFYYYYFF